MAACGEVPAAIVDDDRVALNLGLILPEPGGAGVGRHAGGAVVIELLRSDVDRLVLFHDRRRASTLLRRVALSLRGRR